MPTSMLGFVDDAAAVNIDGYSSAVDYLLENVPQLQHPESVRVYATMRHEPHLSSILSAYQRAVGGAKYAIDPAGCEDETVELIADDLGLPIAGYNDDEEPQQGARRRGFTWAEHLRVAGMDRTYGHAFFEQVWREEAGRWRLAAVAERMPQTVEFLKLNRDGTLSAIVQGSIPKSVEITTADHRLIYYTRERAGSNYFGESMLRPCYGPWLIKSELMRVHATSIRRFGMGVPTAQALPGTSPTPQQIGEAQRVVSGLKAGQFSGVAMPAGFRLALEGMTGSVPDALAFITYLDRLCTRATMTSILDMATAERGNRSLGETVMALMVMAQQDDAKAKCDVGTAQIVIPLVDANFGEGAAAPRICVSSVGADPELSAQDVFWLMAYAGLNPDEKLETYLRDRYGIPARDPNAPPVSPAAPGSQPGPNAPQPPGGAQ
jgi:hypothetical protein